MKGDYCVEKKVGVKRMARSFWKTQQQKRASGPKVKGSKISKRIICSTRCCRNTTGQRLLISQKSCSILDYFHFVPAGVKRSTRPALCLPCPHTHTHTLTHSRCYMFTAHQPHM